MAISSILSTWPSHCRCCQVVQIRSWPAVGERALNPGLRWQATMHRGGRGEVSFSRRFEGTEYRSLQGSGISRRKIGWHSFKSYSALETAVCRNPKTSSNWCSLVSRQLGYKHSFWKTSRIHKEKLLILSQKYDVLESWSIKNV
jgi:hypothetical protein